MAARICLGCDYYKPKFFTVIEFGKECAAFGTCVTVDSCGMRAPSLSRDEQGRQIIPKKDKSE